MHSPIGYDRHSVSTRSVEIVSSSTRPFAALRVTDEGRRYAHKIVKKKIPAEVSIRWGVIRLRYSSLEREPYRRFEEPKDSVSIRSMANRYLTAAITIWMGFGF